MKVMSEFAMLAIVQADGVANATNSSERSPLAGLNPSHARQLKKLKQCREEIMKLLLLRTAGYHDRAAGGFCHPALTAIGSIIYLFLIAGPAAADPYKWCAVYTNGSNCGFTTIEQCRASVSGVGGSCQPNQFYTGPDKTSAQRAPKQAQRRAPSESRAQEHRAQERRATETPASERRGAEDRFQ